MQLHGAQDLARRLRELPKQMSRVALIKAAKAGAEPIVERAQDLAPKGTGKQFGRRTVHLAESIGTRFTRRGALRVVVQIGTEKDAYWGFFIEYGTSKMAAQPFMRPAFDAGAQDAVDAIAAVLRDEVERAERL